MNAKLHYTFDYDFWIRMAQRFELRKIDALMATSRLHRANKTLGEQRPTVDETIGLLLGRFGYVPLGWVCRYSSLLLREKKELFPPGMLPSIASICLSLPLGMVINHHDPKRYIGEWRSLLVNNRFTRPRNATGA
jgi:hypothetical protein